VTIELVLYKTLLTILAAMLMAGCVAAPMRLPTHSVDASGSKGGKLDFSFLKAGVITRKKVDDKLKQLDSGFQNPQLFWGRFVESNWGVGAIGADPMTPVPVAGAARIWHARNLMIEFDSSGVTKHWEILDDQHLDAFLRGFLKGRENTVSDKGPEGTYSVHSCYCTNAPLNDGYVSFSKGLMQLKVAKDSAPIVSVTARQISKISFDTPISEKDNSPEPDFFHIQLHLKEKIERRKVLYLKVQATTLYEFLRFQMSAAS
jgi:hypothetical protein